MEKKFWYRNWWLYYLLFFLLLGLLIYALLWKPRCEGTYTPPTASQISEPQEPQEPSPVEVVECNATVESGGQGCTVTRHALGSKAGRVVVEYAQAGAPQECEVEVYAPEEDTKWDYQLNCPQ